MLKRLLASAIPAAASGIGQQLSASSSQVCSPIELVTGVTDRRKEPVHLESPDSEPWSAAIATEPAGNLVDSCSLLVVSAASVYRNFASVGPVAQLYALDLSEIFALDAYCPGLCGLSSFLPGYTGRVQDSPVAIGVIASDLVGIEANGQGAASTELADLLCWCVSGRDDGCHFMISPGSKMAGLIGSGMLLVLDHDAYYPTCIRPRCFCRLVLLLNCLRYWGLNAFCVAMGHDPTRYANGGGPTWGLSTIRNVVKFVESQIVKPNRSSDEKQHKRGFAQHQHHDRFGRSAILQHIIATMPSTNRGIESRSQHLGAFKQHRSLYHLHYTASVQHRHHDSNHN
ncbi:hypothetical protein Nepgr_002816 [Nepenthes gracilis]|uniref:Uncharacterized protein n=1 Tax=Nepenthes gracilis TaxID=150966 RepID=A0AAD3RXB2_NEPGR|nr:hypothetical protein Nepgr_002816 [Nepenthes gracilis]